MSFASRSPSRKKRCSAGKRSRGERITWLNRLRSECPELVELAFAQERPASTIIGSDRNWDRACGVGLDDLAGRAKVKALTLLFC